ncbi:hypothetical protein L210DRAFT_2472945 [Boletus edulis BED1]|uniref:Uncharacterized protein n=1 Tax=Boletus edulis BED1 TaxID=1328754 RepID=A0AAD4BBU5_BOLED|nr:hypothetical protein L210DRAFT_2472945 [Boletus edulis BED1]
MASLGGLSINLDPGWNANRGGVTPNGLLQLLEACPSLSFATLVIDTRGYTEPPRSEESLGLISPHPFTIDVLDSVIEADTLPAMAAFFAGIVSCHTFRRNYWQDVYKRHLWLEHVVPAKSQHWTYSKVGNVCCLW